MSNGTYETAPRDAAEARQRLLIAIHDAERFGVDVNQVFGQAAEYLLLSRVRIFGLSMAILFIFASPIGIAFLKLYCEKEHLTCPVPDQAFFWLSLMGLTSMLAFGFDLVDPRTLVAKCKQILKKD